jgi:DNA primase
VPDGTVSTPFAWDELPDIAPTELTLATVPARFAKTGDPHATIDDVAYRLDTLLEWADRDGLPE